MERFTWIPFYTELAEKLLEYKDKRKRKKLVNFVYSLGKCSKFIHENDGSNVDDIDPYTVFSIFNRQLSKGNRKQIATSYKGFFEVDAPVPQDFAGIPVMNNQSSTFFWRSTRKEQIPLLWALFEAEINDDKKLFSHYFDELQKTNGIKWNLTMGAYWIKPFDYMPLDQPSRDYLTDNGINVFDAKDLQGEKYLELIKKIKKEIKNGKFVSIPEISNAADGGFDNEDNEDDILKFEDNERITEYINILKLKKNIILQGAPGTGKTYNTAALALSICGEAIPESHNEVLKCYNKLQEEGRIGFCTFHQSMDYEDFVEGIKPKTEGGVVSYNVEDGIFKMMCKNANQITTEKKSGTIDFTKTRVFKMSLGEKGKDDEEIFNYCFENNVVALGWGDNIDFSKCERREDFQAKYAESNWGSTAMEIFKQWMQIGDIVLVSDGTRAVKAIAKIVGKYEYRDNEPINMYQFRKVEWLYSGESIPISKLYDKNLSQQSIYGFYNSNKLGKNDFNGGIKTDFLNDIITGEINNEPAQNYVLIIDEINRGNVSRIFGELITLLEADKRIGGDHPIKVTLPYSKESFGVPSNLYIIGTMNTTDRSVGNIDYAVRRRFAFITLESDRQVVVDKYGEDSQNVQLFDAVETFIKKNKIEMDFEDLMVGHNYFLANGSDELALRWEYEILPLLNEYIKDDIIRAKRLAPNMTVEEFVNDNII